MNAGSEAGNRTAKAIAIADVIAAHDGTSDQAAHLPRKAQLAAARLAGQRPPSSETWNVVVMVLADRERRAAEPVDIDALADLLERMP